MLYAYCRDAFDLNYGVGILRLPEGLDYNEVQNDDAGMISYIHECVIYRIFTNPGTQNILLKTFLKISIIFILNFLIFSKSYIRPQKVNYMFLRHRPRHLQPPPHQKFLLHFQYSH